MMNGYHRDTLEMLVEFLGCEKQGACDAIKLGKILKMEPGLLPSGRSCF